MQAASDATDGSMVSVIGLKSDKVQEICDAAAKQSGEPVQVTKIAGFQRSVSRTLLLSDFLRLHGLTSPVGGRE